MAIVFFAVFSVFIWAFWGYMAFVWHIPQQDLENTPQRAVGSYSEGSEQGLPIIQGNYLLSFSYLPDFKETQVLGVITSDEEITFDNYCDWNYQKQFWREELLWQMTAICFCESGGNPKAVNNSKFGIPEKSIGLFMINLLAHSEYTEEEMKNPEKNTKAAIKIYKKEGLNAWYNCSLRYGFIK